MVNRYRVLAKPRESASMDRLCPSGQTTVFVGMSQRCQFQTSSMRLLRLNLTASERSHLAFLGRFRHAVIVPRS
jgi:hypothetical protein